MFLLMKKKVIKIKSGFYHKIKKNKYLGWHGLKIVWLWNVIA